MGLRDTLRNLFVKQREPDRQSYQEYKQYLAMNKEDIARFKRYVSNDREKLASFRAQGFTDDSPQCRGVIEDLQRFQYSLYEAEKTTKFIRENTEEDIEYRKRQMQGFAKILKELLPEDAAIRFHGTPIYFAEEILKSGGISSSADRFDGYVKSTDQRNEISVSDISSLSRTVDWFMDLNAHQRCLPCGCLFVLDSEGQTEQQRASSVMASVDFKQEPERLKAIVTTPENIASVRQWLSRSGLSADLAFSFDDFVAEVERNVIKETDRKPPLITQISSASSRRTDVNTFSEHSFER